MSACLWQKKTSTLTFTTRDKKFVFGTCTILMKPFKVALSFINTLCIILSIMSFVEDIEDGNVRSTEKRKSGTLEVKLRTFRG